MTYQHTCEWCDKGFATKHRKSRFCCRGHASKFSNAKKRREKAIRLEPNMVLMNQFLYGKTLERA